MDRPESYLQSCPGSSPVVVSEQLSPTRGQNGGESGSGSDVHELVTPVLSTIDTEMLPETEDQGSVDSVEV